MYGGVVFDNFEGVLLVLDYFIFFLGHLISGINSGVMVVNIPGHYSHGW